MEGRKEVKYNLQGICPECGKLIKLELTIATELVEEGTTKKTEAKTDETNKETGRANGSAAESEGVQSDRAEGEPGTTDAVDKPADSKKGTGNKKAGGKAK